MSFSKNQQSHETRIEQMLETRSKLEENIRNHQSTKERLDREIHELKQQLSVSETKLADVCIYVCTDFYGAKNEVYLLSESHACIYCCFACRHNLVCLRVSSSCASRQQR